MLPLFEDFICHNKEHKMESAMHNQSYKTSLSIKSCELTQSNSRP